MIKELCRLCGNKTEDMLNIFSESSAEQNIPLKIKEVLHISIIQEDPLPNVVCSMCIKHLENAFVFINYCHQTQAYLKELCCKNALSECVEIKEETHTNNVFVEQLDSMCTRLPDAENSNTKCSIPEKSILHDILSSTDTETTGNTYVTESRNTVSFSHIRGNSNANENKSAHQESCDDPIGFETDSSEEERINESTENVETNEDSEASDEDVTFISSDEQTDIVDEKVFPAVHEEINISDDESDHETTSKKRKLVQKPKTPIKSKTGQGDESVTAQLLKDPAPAPPKEKKRLRCATCDLTFSQELTYEEHLNVHTGNRPFTCKLCEATFRKRQELNQHLRTVHSEKQFKCTLCDHVAKHKGKLTEHMKSVHEKPFACDLCHYRTGEKGKIMQHIASKHTGESSYVCEICGNGFKTKTSLQNHRQNIHFPEPKVCQTCGTVCPSLGRYSAHIFRCGKEKKRYPCDTCGRSYVNKDILKDHMNKHLNVRPYKCDVCGKEFFQRNRLDTHKYVHRGAAYSCEVCNQSFNRKDNMKNHMKKHFYKSMRYDNTLVTAV